MAGLASFAVVLLMLQTVADVVMRYFFNRPLPGTVDWVASWWMVIIAFGGLALAEQDDEHISTPVLVHRLVASAREYLARFSRFCVLLLAIPIVYYSTLYAVEQMARGESAIASGLPIWPPRFLVPIGLVALLLTMVRTLRRDVTSADDEDDDD